MHRNFLFSSHMKKRIQQEVQQNIWTHKYIWYHKLIRGSSPPQLIYLTIARSHCGDGLSPRLSASPPLCIHTFTRYLIPNKCRPMLLLSKILDTPPSPIVIWPLYPCANFRRGPKIFKKGSQKRTWLWAKDRLLSALLPEMEKKGTLRQKGRPQGDPNPQKKVPW